MPGKKYTTQEEKEYAYRVNSKKYYWKKKGITPDQAKTNKLIKKFVKDFLKNDESFLKVYNFITTEASAVEPSVSESD